MTLDARHAAIRTRFKDFWAGQPPTQFPNQKFTPPDNLPWMRLVIQDAGVNWASMGDPGNNVARNVGQVTVQIFTPSGDGEGLALEIANQALAVFRSWSDTATGLRFEVPPYARQVGVEGKWYQINVVAPFKFDDFM